MLIHTMITLLIVVSTATAAALHPGRQVSPLDSIVAQQACSLATVYSYLTVTVTHVPPTVTIAVPDYSSISRSLASVSTIDSLVVVENSINRPVDAPPNTIVPTFIHTINAPAVEATEAPHADSSVVLLPNTKSPHTVAIGTVTESIIISPFRQPVASPSAAQVAPLQNTNFTIPAGGWNGTNTNATAISLATGAGPTAGQLINSTITQTTYVSTTTYIASETVTPAWSSYPTSEYSDPGYGGYGTYDEYSGNIKRQTCVMISAQINGHWASWCNNWDGSTTYSYTSWETTVIPGTDQSGNSIHPTTSASSAATSASVTATPAQSGDSSTCGQVGAFNINFDNLPPQSSNDTANVGLPPIIEPFEHFFWAQGWSWTPPPSGPYSPHSGKQLAIFVPPVQTPPTFPTTNLEDLPLGGFGSAQRSPIDAYWFNVASAWIGCDNSVANSLTDKCEIYAQGYVYDEQSKAIRLASNAYSYFDYPLCHSKTCQLQQIHLHEGFSNLSAINFYAKVGADIRGFYMDDVELSWSNNTCEAGRLRASMKR